MDIDEFKQRKVKRGYVWLKLFTDLIDEPEFMQLTDKAKAVYFEVYILAGRSDAGGLITSSDKPAKLDQLAWFLRRTIDELQGALDELQNTGFVDLQGGQITVRRFGNEQGPGQDEKRAQWREWQRESRARARGETLPDEPDANTEPNTDTEAEKEKDTNTEKELKNQTKTKRVSQMSGKSQGGVRTDINSDLVLSVWRDITGLEYKPGNAFHDMVKDWQRAGATVQNVSDAIAQVNGQANTPMYLRNIVLSLHDNEPEAQSQKNLEKFRQLYREQKQAGGDNGIHE